MWELDLKECWVLKKTLESLLDSKESKPVNPKGSQPWIFIGKTDTKAEAPVLWPPAGKSQLIGKDWCWETLEAGGEGCHRGQDVWMASLKFAQWCKFESLKVCKFEQIQGDSEGQGSRHAAVHRQNQTGLRDWTTITLKFTLKKSRDNGFWEDQRRHLLLSDTGNFFLGWLCFPPLKYLHDS